VILVDDGLVRSEPGDERLARLAVQVMGVGGRHHIGAGGVHGVMDDEGGAVDRPAPFDHLSLMIDQNQVRHPHMAKAASMLRSPVASGQGRAARA
jgi:hypothetical protein